MFDFSEAGRPSTGPVGLKGAIVFALILFCFSLGFVFAQTTPDYRPNNGGVVRTSLSPEAARAGQTWEPVSWFHEERQWGTLGWGSGPSAVCQMIRHDPPLQACPHEVNEGDWYCDFDCRSPDYLPVGRACKAFIGERVLNPDYVVRLYMPVAATARCYCLEGMRLDPLTLLCQPAELQLTFDGEKEVRPAGVGGNSTANLKARVTRNGEPRADVALSFELDVAAFSGGHDHHDPSRPKGTLSSFQGTTDARGELAISFRAPEVAGIHTVKATCAGCANGPVTQEVHVKVSGLVKMEPDNARPATYALVGSNERHRSNHWFAVGARSLLLEVVDLMSKTGWGTVGINDGSLPWGGLFDVAGGWRPPHHTHRVGTEVDLSVKNPRQITDAQKKNTYAELCKAYNAAFSVQTLWHHDDGYPEHFHLYLGSGGLTGQAGRGPCCMQYKVTRAKKDRNGNPIPGVDGKPMQETVKLCNETSPR